ncbi:MAG: hypothetical protein ACREX3_05495 [Gammaproteobacteria bacterium]
MMPDPERIKILYIASTGRSGKTLLEVMLGRLPGVLSAGEVTHIWKRGFELDQLCGCGERFSRCPFWSRVVLEAFGKSSGIPVSDIIALRERVCSIASLPQMAIPALRTPAFQSRLAQYSEHLLRLYEAIRKVCNCRVILDSSKYPPELFLLHAIERVDLSVVHLVRNSNAVVHAWRKWKVRPEIHWRREFMPRHGRLKTAMAWNVYNAVIGSMPARGVPYRLVRYEDLIQRPHETIAMVAELLDGVDCDLRFIGEDGVELGINHTVAGNPVRFERGTIPLHLDQEWEERVPLIQKQLVNLLTLYHQRKYGYIGRLSQGPGQGTRLSPPSPANWP